MCGPERKGFSLDKNWSTNSATWQTNLLVLLWEADRTTNTFTNNSLWAIFVLCDKHLLKNSKTDILINLLGMLLSLQSTIIMGRFTYAKQETVKDIEGYVKIQIRLLYLVAGRCRQTVTLGVWSSLRCTLCTYLLMFFFVFFLLKEGNQSWVKIT